ncbi:hypothetical protein B0F90DRAFT_783219 [Multifurca ochricompacta]|uniref:Uncharacterized protein n=1 Tax=Multifurca ochricompacta TaxID=376703 RepID=A0AAD4MCK4_9AGAM|nr:hypothetical protein B0F90DRAFT_783219 [Multifurca ochricompacta]
MRLHHTLDSALSGGITGAVLNAWKRGARGTYPGMMFGSAFCALGQFLHNELDVQRIKYVSQRLLSSSSRLPSPKYLARLREERATCLQRIAELEARAEFDKDSKHHPST